MLAPPTLVPCPECARHVRPHEPSCPHCGERLAGPGPLRRTAAAVLLGLTAATTLSTGLVGCAVYGVACTRGRCGDDTTGTGGAGGAGGTGGTGGEDILVTGGSGGQGGSGGG